MASIYGPPEHQRRRKRRPAPGTVKTTPMQMFWMVVALVFFVVVMLNLEKGDPDLDETLRQLEQIQRRHESYRPLDPALFELPKFEPIILEPPSPIELELPPPPPAEPARKPRKKTTRRPPRPAPDNSLSDRPATLAP